MNTENGPMIDTAVADILAELEKRAENTSTDDYINLAIALLYVENIVMIDTAALSKSLLLELEKNPKSTYTFDIASLEKLIEGTKLSIERSNFYEFWLSNRVLENTSMSGLTSILDDFSYPVGQWFIDTAIDHSPLKDRQDVCNFLGIRESTLSGWIKDERVPRMAQVALIFLMSFEGLKRQTKISRIKMATPIPVKMGETWGLVQTEENEDGEIKATLIAEGISDYEQASRLAQGTLATEQLEDLAVQFIETIWHQFEYSDGVFEYFSGPSPRFMNLLNSTTLKNSKSLQDVAEPVKFGVDSRNYENVNNAKISLNWGKKWNLF